MIEPHDGAGHELQFQMTRSPIETPGDKSRYTKALVVRGDTVRRTDTEQTRLLYIIA
jgi:hypothetical protein